VLLLFADQAALRHFGAATAALPDLEAEIAANAPVQFGIFEEAEVQIQRAREEATRRCRPSQPHWRELKQRLKNEKGGGRGPQIYTFPPMGE
jgi:hypothetical protein